MKNSEKKQLDFEVSIEQIKSYRKAYYWVLSLVAILELYMIVRSLINAVKHSGFNSWERFLYFVAYLVLFAFSVITLYAILSNRKQKSSDVLLVQLIDVYGALIIIWSATITFLDIRNDHTMIVFMTVIMCVAALTNIKPIIFVLTVSPLAAILLVSAYLVDSPLITTGGYAINFFIYVLFSDLLSVIKHRLTEHNYVATKELERLSFYDQLTGAYNRHSLRNYFNTTSKHTIFYFGIIDVDNFKSINDTFGHDIGDKCLKEIADQLKQEFGQNVYRYGGDEFVVISEKREHELALSVTKVNEYLTDNFAELNVHISAGFYCPVSNTEEYQDIFKNADIALYQAKTTGKGKAVVYKNE